MKYHRLEKRGFTTISGAKGYLRALKAKGIKITREKYLPDWYDPWEKTINIARKDGPNSLHRIGTTVGAKHSPLQVLAHEGGHVDDMPNGIVQIAKNIGRAVTRGGPGGLLRKERVANRNAIKNIQKYEKPEEVGNAIKKFKTTVRPAYNTYRKDLIRRSLLRSETRKGFKSILDNRAQFVTDKVKGVLTKKKTPKGRVGWKDIVRDRVDRAYNMLVDPSIGSISNVKRYLRKNPQANLKPWDK